MSKKTLITKIKEQFQSENKLLQDYKNVKIEFERLRNSVNPKDLKPAKSELRQYQLETLDFSKKWFDKFKELNIEYFFIGGNLLGTYRNNRFIPWDDDIDVGMMRNDFNNLLKYLRENYVEMPLDKISLSHKNRYKVTEEFLKQHPNEICFAVFYHLLSIFKGTNVTDQVALEIFPYDYYSEDFELSNFKNYAGHIKKEIIKSDNFQKINEFLENERKNNKLIVEKSNKIFCGIDHYNFQDFTIPYFFEKDDIFPLQQMQFENIICCVPNKIEKVLFEIYGEGYDKMPNMIYPQEHIKFRESMTDYKFKNIFNFVHYKKKEKPLRDFVLSQIRYKYSNKKQLFSELYKKYKTAYDFLKEVSDE